MQIVEDQHHRSVLRGAVQQIRDRVEEPCLLEPRLGPDRIGRLDDRDEASDLAAVFGHMRVDNVGVETGQGRAQGFGEGLVGHCEVFLAATEQNERALVVRAPSRRRHQAGLAHARFTGDEHSAARTRGRRVARDTQDVELRCSGRRAAPPASQPAPAARVRVVLAAASTRIVHAGTGSAMPFRMSSPTASY